ncbi:MAG: dUTP diphosphatase [Flavobacteriaceae bacterium]|nr:dUTP diphosphatase [Flavobacteriaceae bacterium]|tara:strand:+ start:19205 stop:19639 length:435 start_codon:yes stop_codon:yes gene_type:complete
MVKISVVNKSSFELPSYQSALAAGLDLRANLSDKIVIYPMERKLIPSGLFIALPQGYEAQIRPRSGLAIKYGITVLNSPGTIDSDYRGEIGIILINLSNERFVVNSGDRIAQMVISKHEQIKWEVLESLPKSNRGEKGFGSTGK